MAKFCAALYRRHPKTDFRMLLHFLSSQLRSNHSVDLIVLTHMIESMVRTFGLLLHGVWRL